MPSVRGRRISCTPCRRRGRGAGYLLCLNQVTHPPTRTSQPDPFIPRSITTLTRWEASLLNPFLVMMDVGGVERDRIGGSGMTEKMRTRARTRWKLVSSILGSCVFMCTWMFFSLVASSHAQFPVGACAIPPGIGFTSGGYSRGTAGLGQRSYPPFGSLTDSEPTSPLPPMHDQGTLSPSSSPPTSPQHPVRMGE